MTKRNFVFAAIALLSFPAFAALPAFKGDDACAYGTHGCNACVPDVAKAFAAMGGRPDRRHTFKFKQRNPSLNLKIPKKIKIEQHIQGITRIPGLDHENWVALSHSQKQIGDGGFYLVRFDFIHSDGGAWKHANRLSDQTRSYYHFRTPGTNHAGGMQALGTMLFTANECGAGKTCTAFISVHDVRDPSSPRMVSRLDLDGSQGELGPYVSNMAAVAASRLDDGRILLFFRGGQRDENGWFFVSDSPGINERTKWIFVQSWHRSELAADSPWYPWENLNFLTECGTGDIYLVGLGTRKSRMGLYRLTTGSRVGFDYVADRRLNTSGLLTSLRSAGGVHVTPEGRLLTYVTDRRPPVVKIEEFR